MRLRLARKTDVNLREEDVTCRGGQAGLAENDAEFVREFLHFVSGRIQMGLGAHSREAAIEEQMHEE